MVYWPLLVCGWTEMNYEMMNKRQPSLISILQPPRFETNELRARVTRTVLQPEIDKFEQREADSPSASIDAASAG